MNKGFAKYLASKTSGSTMAQVAKSGSKVKTAPKNLKHGKYL